MCVKLRGSPPPHKDPTKSPAASVSVSGLILGKATNKTNTKIGCKDIWTPDLDLPLTSLRDLGQVALALRVLVSPLFSRGAGSSQG